jgi:hypothetical protein
MHFLFLLLFPLVANAQQTPTFTLARQTVDVYDFAEITMRQAPFKTGNPFTDLTLTGIVVGPDADTVRVQGFCDAANGSLFRLRFMPRKPGQYRVVVTGQFSGSLSTKKPLSFLGTFTATASKRRGMVQMDKNYPAHFVYEGTNGHYFWNSTTTYWLMGWRNEATIRAAIDRLAVLKINRIRVVINGRQDDGKRWAEPLVKESPGFTFKLNPWVAADSTSLDNPGFDVTRFNVGHWQRMDRMLEYARDRGINVSVIFYVDGLEHGSDPFKKANMGGTDEQRYYQYAVNRFAGFSNVMWDVTNEYHLFRSETWAEKMGTFLRQADPYDHLTSIHGNADFPFRASPWVDFLMVQNWDECGGYYAMRQNADRQAKTGFVKPQINEEYGYENHYPEWGCGSLGKRTAPARNAQNRTRLAWEICMAGAYQTTGERADQGTGAGADTGGGWINGRGDSTMTLLKYHAILHDVFTSVAWWRMTPRPEITHHGTLCLTDADNRQYLLYVQSGTPTLVTPKQLYRVRVINIWTGQSRALPDFAGGVWIGPQDLGGDVAVVFDH